MKGEGECVGVHTHTRFTYLGESGTHYLLKLEDGDRFIGYGEMRKARGELVDKYGETPTVTRVRACKRE